LCDVQQNTHRSYTLRVSFLEIYNEQLRDLLAPPPSSTASGPTKPPEIIDNGHVKNLVERAVSLPSEVLEVLKEGEQRRRVGATDWNERSSRSHCVFVVVSLSSSCPSSLYFLFLGEEND
jgi:centromeric protein E